MARTFSWCRVEHGMFFLIFITILANCVEDYVDSKSELNTRMEVRAVFINCEPDERHTLNSEGTRFEREELYRHSVLRDCNKKIALTIKIAGEPDLSSGDEYIPIENVYHGSNRRVRLLNPYILRLRQDAPLQAYKLRRVDTVSGILTNSGDNDKRRSGRFHRGLDRGECFENKYSAETISLVHKERGRLRDLQTSGSTHREAKTTLGSKESVLNNVCTSDDSRRVVRSKRHEHNIVVEKAIDDNKSPDWIAKDHFAKSLEEDGVVIGIYDETSHTKELDDDNEYYKRHIKVNSITEPIRQSDNKLRLLSERNRQSEMLHSNPWNSISKESNYKTVSHRHGRVEKSNAKEEKDDMFNIKLNDEKSRSTHKCFQGSLAKNIDIGSAEKDFSLYEIGNPDLWYTVHVQLFEKCSTPEGKTVWNDITKGELASVCSVSTLSPEWTGQDINVRYRPAEWVTRAEFTLPMTSLCLLAPIGSVNFKSPADNTNSSLDEGYIVVPKEDIMRLEDDGSTMKKGDDNDSNLEYTTRDKSEQGNRRVMVRVSRALFGDTDDRLSISSQGADEYLTLPHRRPHLAQIDLEARADENQLVLVGSSGCISTVVADSTRPTRTILTLQATNTGLAAARFRAVARDCGPELSSLLNEKGANPIGDSPVLLPPRHTRRLQLEVPIEIPIDVAHCSVALVNGDDESVAVREVSIKKGDRCFCVWHCECVCLSDDSKLLCREMTQSRQAAAGLAARERPRHARSVCYHDVVAINIIITIVGVIMVLLILGLGKALAGLVCRCVGSWGLDRMLYVPRKLDGYYESSLSSFPVVYDEEGWPVNPYTKKRTVRLVSTSMEFILNVIFFVTVPCLIVYDAVKLAIASRNKSDTKNYVAHSFNKRSSKCFSSQDIQDQKSRLRRRRTGLRRWMTPEAEDLSADIWRKGLTLQPSMQPLLHKQCCRDGRTAAGQEPCVDSEQDDTDYVLMQMQKSRESLARSQRKQIDSGRSSAKNH